MPFGPRAASAVSGREVGGKGREEVRVRGTPQPLALSINNSDSCSLF